MVLSTMGAVATETVLTTAVVMETVLMASVGTEVQLIIYKYRKKEKNHTFRRGDCPCWWLVTEKQ